MSARTGAAPRRLPVLHVVAVVLASTSAAPPARAQVDASYSYYLPTAGTVTLFTGVDAIRYFRACPNNDGGSSLPAHARIRIHLANGSGGIAGLTPYLKFNGGTAVQDPMFVGGNGADSIIANGIVNITPPCPLVQQIPADHPTDSSGDTELTFNGAGGVRDPSRKWGHYDCEIPVYVMDGGTEVKILGMLNDPGTAGPFTPATDPDCGVPTYGYVLRIKNFDWTGGLGTGLNQGEQVTVIDYNGTFNGIGAPPNPLTYWKDLDSSGTITVTDVNIVVAHITHNCGVPNAQ